MPRYVEDHQVYDIARKRRRRVKLTIDCPAEIIDHINTAWFAETAFDCPDKTFTITVKLSDPD